MNIKLSNIYKTGSVITSKYFNSIKTKKLINKLDNHDFVTKLLSIFSGITLIMLLFVGGYAYYCSKEIDTKHKKLKSLYTSHVARIDCPASEEFIFE